MPTSRRIKRARQHLDPLGIPIEVAAAEFANTKRKLGDFQLSEAIEYFLKRHRQKIEPRPVQTVVNEFIAAKTSDGVSHRYLQSLDWSLGKFTDAFHCNIGDVTGPAVDDWLRQLRLSPRTRNN